MKNNDNDDGKNGRQETTEQEMERFDDVNEREREKKRRTPSAEKWKMAKRGKNSKRVHIREFVRIFFAARLIGLSTVDWTTHRRHPNPKLSTRASDRICRRITRPRLVEREWSIIAISPYREVDCRLKRNPWKKIIGREGNAYGSGR